ncbi:MAG: molybdopterin-synthase adenylyltransferase MoeB [Pseudomonadales bacterium]|jgi:adenylyltransferase/sulfurtransferase|nr:molybdopterin-synthase adenylyltransferase MoeB [Pseudomonadales bacterium]
MDDARLLRYSRQILLPEIDVAGQTRLAEASVAIVGLGGLGSAAALYLAAAGCGHLRLCDDDRVDPSNLQRQILHGEADLGRRKTDAARDRIHALDSGLRIDCVTGRVDAERMDPVLAGIDLVIDASDNLATRYALNRGCLDARIPWVSAAALRFDGQLTAFDPRRAESPCYRCLWPTGTEDEERCAESGVIAPLVGIMGTLEALEGIKLLTGVGTPLVGRVLTFDGRSTDFQSFRLQRRAACADCGRP